MELSFSTAQNGLHAANLRQNNIADNLANLTTPAFKGGLPAQTTLRGPGTLIRAVEPDLTQGAPEQTGVDTNIFIDGEGFLQVQTDGAPAYTRLGNLHIDQNGDLVTPSGHLLDPGINVPQEAVGIQVALDGTVSAIDGSGNASQIGQLELVRFINPQGLIPIGDSLYTQGPDSGDPQTGVPGDPGFGHIRQGFLEGSNVDPAQEITKEIVNQRYYQLNLRVFQTSDTLVGKAIDLLS